jgi:hypothetical protein
VEPPESITSLATTGPSLLSEGAVFGVTSKEKFLKDGKLPLKIIAPGWGSSGFYGPDILAEASQNNIFPAGTKMFWDHPSITEAVDRPERSLRDLAATFDTPAKWDPKGPKGPGLYSNVTVFTQFREAVWEMAPHIGPSIRALGPVKFGEAEGKKGPIVEGIIAAQSVDFVTAPGRGGEILQLFEAARPAAAPIVDVAPEVNPPTPQGDDAVELQEAQRLIGEKDTQITTLNESVRTLTSERDDWRTKAERASGALILREAKDFATAELAKNQVLPDIVKTRLIETVSRNPQVNDKGELDKDKIGTQLTEAVKTEVAYIAALTGSGEVRNLGGDPAPAGDTSAVTTALSEAFQAFGLDEKQAAAAASGRG